MVLESKEHRSERCSFVLGTPCGTSDFATRQVSRGKESKNSLEHNNNAFHTALFCRRNTVLDRILSSIKVILRIHGVFWYGEPMTLEVKA